jgi:ribonuclease P protein component
MSPTVERSRACGSGIIGAVSGPNRSLGMGQPSLPEEATREEDLSTEHPSACSPSWFPAPHGDPRRSAHRALPPSTGSCPAIGLIWRIRDRATFVELARRGRRVSSGPLTVVHLAEKQENPSISGDSTPPVSHPRVAFAVPRAVGAAVERNRVRRRIRSICLELATADRMAPGAWLFIVRPGAPTLTFCELNTLVSESVQSLSSRQVAS